MILVSNSLERGDANERALLNASGWAIPVPMAPAALALNVTTIVGWPGRNELHHARETGIGWAQSHQRLRSSSRISGPPAPGSAPRRVAPGILARR